MPRLRRVVSVVGTRPNFMKTAPVVAELARLAEFESILVHTGQHYDDAMSRVFFEELAMTAPDHSLDVGSGTHAVQTARVMERLEPLLLATRPDLVIVPGDVNSTVAAALTSAKLGIPVAHIEAGLRSFDRTMPEELNRVLTDQLADLLFIHSPEARDNLLREGRPDGSIHAVGNTMIDTLVAMRPAMDALGMTDRVELDSGEYLVVTLHRPALVDDRALLATAISEIDLIADDLPVVFPVHPRTRNTMEREGIAPRNPRVRLLDPLGYLEFLGLVSSAAGVLTDSGGIQEETTYLGVPCFTLRDSTERPITLEMGTNTLLGLDPARVREIPGLIARAADGDGRIPPQWDGHAAERIVEILGAYVEILGA